MLRMKHSFECANGRAVIRSQTTLASSSWVVEKALPVSISGGQKVLDTANCREYSDDGKLTSAKSAKAEECANVEKSTGQFLVTVVTAEG